ncbi:MAG: radical SAM family heme chaperone HemW [Paludibacteraceae bacterium]|nr:radical SAM family heme chaperone HemW [Paludibacteraceae bacterium]
MAGIYIHIPFCKSRCKYCDFYSTTLLQLRDEYTEALTAELECRTDYLHKDTLSQTSDQEPQNTNRISTIYFGGGTPSLLRASQIEQILQKIRELFEVENEAEITIEANPGDLNAEYLHQLVEAGVNRLSIGIQSFNNEYLRLLGRRHTAQEAKEAVRAAREAGFDNISIDLIYGIPGQSLQDWQDELRQAISLNIEHISTYCLTYEEGTEMSRMLQKGEIKAVDDDTENEMYATMVNMLKDNGFEHYEVSNFALPGYRSQHNSSYWNNTPYLGTGAAAHSYDGEARQWNISDIREYIRQAKAHCLQPEREVLSERDKYNERVMLSLRTAEGTDLSKLTNEEQTYCLRQAQPYIDNKQLTLADNRLVATMSGINILNLITEKLMK